tara:strand:- start:52 stop:357 length:306 start_codon:yes stop_codon:yes gene_type:complete
MNKKYECFYCGTVEKIKFAEGSYPYQIGNDEVRDRVMVYEGDPICGCDKCSSFAPVKKGKAELMQKIMVRIHEEIEAGLRDADGCPYTRGELETIRRQGYV